MKKFWFLLFIYPMLLFAELDVPKEVKNFYPNNTNQVLPEGFFYDVENQKLILDQFEGKILLVTFWASWCMECREELKLLDALQKDLRKQPLKILPLSIDYKNIETLKEFYTAHKINYLDIYKDTKANLYNALRLHGLPNTLLIDTNGAILGIFKGMVNWSQPELRNWLVSLMQSITYDYMQDKDYQLFLQRKIGKPKEQ